MSDPLSPKSPRKGKIVNLRILFLDDTLHAFQVPVKAVGSALWEAVVKHLQLLEADYFDLQYVDSHDLQCWLDREKPILKQIPSSETPLRFCIKFYTPDPGLLEDEYTRYLFALQIKRDLATGDMPCTENTAVLLASYVAQAEIGDCPVDDYTDHTYLSGFKFVPHQTMDLEKKIMEYHRQHVGESPAESDLNLLDTARKVECYGVKIQSAKDHEAVPLNLAVAHVGVLVFQNSTKINTFSWAKVRKLSFKRKKFLIKLHPENYGYYKDTVEFFFESRNECKCFWKKCIEHHAFFRCHSVKKLPRNKTRVVSRGSSFRYSGRTQKQLIEHLRETFVKRPPFERTVSGRISSRSTSVTPKIHPKTAIHNSSDLHNSTASSGSHTLERTHGSQQLSNRVETAEVHSDSSMSGSRSLGSPKLERDRSQDETRLEGTVDTGDEIDEGGTSEKAEIRNAAVMMVLLPPEVTKPVSLHGLSPADRKLSAPVLGAKDAQPPLYTELEKHLSRCEEIEDIPATVEETEEYSSETRRESLQRSVSAAPMSAEMVVSPAALEAILISEPEPEPEPESQILIESHSVRPDSLSQNMSSSPVDAFDDESPPLPSPPPIIEQVRETPPPSPPPPLPPPPLDENYICLSPPSQRSIPKRPNGSTSSSTGGLPSNVSVLSSTRTEDSEEDSKRKIKRHPVDRSYYIAKELLMTERTYKKDLEVITVWFCNAVSADEGIPEYVTNLFLDLDPIYQFHCEFLKEIDQRLSMWEGKSNAHVNGNYQRIGDIMLNSFSKVLELYKKYMERQESMLFELEQAVKKNKAFEQTYKDFESQKVCYLPLNTFLLKPSQRLLHIKLILERLTKHYSIDHPDYSDCSAALNNIVEVISVYKDSVKELENLQKLMELQRDLVGIDNLIQSERYFIREGCLQKFSRKGYQQRMFFLFSDILIYTSRSASALLQFKVHGELPLKGMLVEESEQAKMAVQNSFAIYGGNKCILVAASSQEEKDKWIEDLNDSIARDKGCDDNKLKPASLKSSSSENVDNSGMKETSEKQIQHRANTTMHVCWHRNTSVSMKDHEKAIRNQLSGYLLRKFKNSNGWQKLWVVFTNFCLFFYKSYQDDFPLASLPLLGYAVNTPVEEDNIHKDHVFKLQFKNHIYYFRAESEYTFSRWMEVINCATSSAHRTRLFSRMDSSVRSASKS